MSDGFVPASQTNLSNSNQNFNLTAWMVGLADPGQYGQLNLYEVPQGTAGPANADAEISANKQVSSDITLLDQHGSEVLLGETLMVPIANSMVYLRPLYASPTTNPQPQLQYVVGVLGKNVQIDTSLSAVLSDLLNTTVSLPSESGGVSSTGTVPAAVAGILQQAQTDYTNALAALKAEQPGAVPDRHQRRCRQAIAQAQDVIGATTPGATTTTTTTTVPPAKGGRRRRRDTTTTTTHASTTASTTTTSVPTSTEPKNTTSTTSTTLVSAAPKT